MIITILPYITAGILSFIVTLFSFTSFLKSKGRASGFFVLTLFLISIHAFVFVAPILLIPGNEILLGLGYIYGVGLIFITFLSSLEVIRPITRLSYKFISLITLFTTVFAVITLSLMIVDFRTPTITEVGVILWNVNVVSRILIGISSVFYGLFWGLTFFEAIRNMSSDSAVAKLKFIAVAGIILGISGFMTHTSTEPLQTIIGHILFIGSGLIAITAYLYKS